MKRLYLSAFLLSDLVKYVHYTANTFTNKKPSLLNCHMVSILLSSQTIYIVNKVIIHIYARPASR